MLLFREFVGIVKKCEAAILGMGLCGDLLAQPVRARSDLAPARSLYWTGKRKFFAWIWL